MAYISIIISNGTAPYHVELIPDIGTTWDFPTSGPKLLDSIPAGDFCVKVTDSNGCVVTTCGVVVTTTTSTTTTTEEPVTTTTELATTTTTETTTTTTATP